MKRIKKSIFIPLLLLIYLAVMAFIGRDILISGNYLEYFGIIAVSLLCIAGLYYTLRTQERMRAQRRRELDELEQKTREKVKEDENTKE